MKGSADLQLADLIYAGDTQPCGFPCVRGPCQRALGSCPYHPSQSVEHVQGKECIPRKAKKETEAGAGVEAEDYFPCPRCAKVFSTLAAVSGHKRHCIAKPEEKILAEIKSEKRQEDKDEDEETDEAEDPCELCGERSNPDRMLACDGCDRGFHMFCLAPPLEEIPKGDWFCADCQGAAEGKKANSKAIELPSPGGQGIEEDPAEMTKRDGPSSDPWLNAEENTLTAKEESGPNLKHSNADTNQISEEPVAENAKVSQIQEAMPVPVSKSPTGNAASKLTTTGDTASNDSEVAIEKAMLTEGTKIDRQVGTGLVSALQSCGPEFFTKENVVVKIEDPCQKAAKAIDVVQCADASLGDTRLNAINTELRATDKELVCSSVELSRPTAAVIDANTHPKEGTVVGAKQDESIQGKPIAADQSDEWDYQGQLTVRTVLDVYLYWLKKRVRLGKPLIRYLNSSVRTWLREVDSLVRPSIRPTDSATATGQSGHNL